MSGQRMTKGRRLLARALAELWRERYGRRPVGELRFATFVFDFEASSYSAMAVSDLEFQQSKALISDALAEAEGALFSPRVH